MEGPFSEYYPHPDSANPYCLGYGFPAYEEESSETYYIHSSSSSSSSSSPSVDCTLSLGTPSTRYLSHDNYEHPPKPTPHPNSFHWDLDLHSSTPTQPPSSKPHRSSSDTLLARRCANCDTTSTPLWRNGPRGPKSLCNACGIRFKKEERRAAAANNSAAMHNGGAAAAGFMDPNNAYYNGPWAQQYGQGGTQKMQCYGAPNEFRFMEEEPGSDSGYPFLSWLTHDRPSGLVHDFTR